MGGLKGSLQGDTGFLTFEAAPSEATLLDACLLMRKQTGELPQVLLVGWRWWSLFCRTMFGTERRDLAFLVDGVRVRLVPDGAQSERGVTVIPRRIGATDQPQNEARIGA